MDPPVRLEEAEEAQLRRWHPKFLTSDIPEVSAATDIPQVSAADPVFSAKDFLNSAKPNLPKEVETQCHSFVGFETQFVDLGSFGP